MKQRRFRVPAGVLPAESFRHRIQYWSGRLHAQPREVALMRMTRKWASCSSRGRVCFSRELLGLPPQAQDYVIVHELLHLRHANHGPVFRALIRASLSRRTIRIAERSLAVRSKGTSVV